MDLSAYDNYDKGHESHYNESLENASKMPRKTEAIRKSFRTVREHWKNSRADFDKEIIGKCYARWEELDKTFEDIATEMNALVSKSARRIYDFATSFCNFIGNKDDRNGAGATMEEKQEHLAQFRNELFSEQTSLFGPKSKNLYDLEVKITNLSRDVRIFDFEYVTHDFPGKDMVIKEIENLEGKLREMKLGILEKHSSNSRGQGTGFFSGVSAILSLCLGEKGALDNFVEASLECHNEDCEKKMNAQQLKKEIAEKKCVMKMRNEVWGKHTRNCEEQIKQINDQLPALACIWMALCSDTAELDTGLELVVKGKMHEDLFYRRLATAQQLYLHLYNILCEFTHPKTPGLTTGVHKWDKSCEASKVHDENGSGGPTRIRKRDKAREALSKILRFESHKECDSETTPRIRKRDRAYDTISKALHFEPRARIQDQ